MCTKMNSTLITLILYHVMHGLSSPFCNFICFFHWYYRTHLSIVLKEVNYMKKFIAVLTAAFAALFILCIKYPSEAFAEEECRAYVLMEAKTQTVLEEYNSNTEYNIGYLSKLMSLLLIAEDLETGKFRIDTELTVPDYIYNIQGAVVWLEPGEKTTVEELLKAVVTGNANDAILTLAAASEQTIDDFVSRMNSRAFDLGLRNTAFYSPSGLSDEREHSTAHDIAVICAQLSRYESLEPYFRIWRDSIRGGKTDIISENRLTRTYPKHIGFKECNSKLSGYCIAEAGRNEKGETYIAVVLGSENQDTAESKATRLLRSMPPRTTARTGRRIICPLWIAG